MLALKHWKSQEAASYSPAVTLFFFFLFMQLPCLVAAVIVTVVRAHVAALLFMQEFYVTVARARRCWRFLAAVLLGKTLTNQQRNRLQTFATITHDVKIQKHIQTHIPTY